MKTKLSILMCVLLVILTSCKTEEPTSVTDIDGNVYNIVKIGNQYWMAENLKVTKYRNGDVIGTTTPANKDLTTTATPKHEWSYDGNETYSTIYGRLYSWYAITDTRQVAPTGWHIPTDAEWNELITFLGGEDVAGGKMKEAGTMHWQSPNTGADNSSGFAARPAGNRNLNGQFFDLGYHTAWWSATANSSGSGNYRIIHKNEPKIFSSFYSDIKVGFSVRCVKDK